MWCLHYVKRLLEVAFVHTFSRATAPRLSLVRNAIYYWGFAAAIAFRVCRRPREVGIEERFAALEFVLFELLNGYCHFALKRLRSNGSAGHGLPTGFLFNSIACPNYTAEIFAWVSFAIFARVAAAWFFVACGAAQMWIWAGRKRRRLAAAYPAARSRGRLLPLSFL
jgi:very-long-chain enoyl-CoA reductase